MSVIEILDAFSKQRNIIQFGSLFLQTEFNNSLTYIAPLEQKQYHVSDKISQSSSHVLYCLKKFL